MDSDAISEQKGELEMNIWHGTQATSSQRKDRKYMGFNAQTNKL